jgi:hypothetical protein
MATITEALAEIKTIQKRLESKRASIMSYLARQDAVRDPLEKTGGSFQFIERERQAIGDLETRIINLRRGIQHANDATKIAINGSERTISEWLTWRREIADHAKSFLGTVRTTLNQVRTQAQRAGGMVVTAGTEATSGKDYVVNIDEAALAREIETMEETLGTLDGQLSLKNATTLIEE